MNSGITKAPVSGQDFSPSAGTCIDVLNIGGIESESIVDGPGFRYTVFVQGCHFRCPGCHNPQLQDFSGGRKMTVNELLRDIKANPLLDGLTLSGGDPFTQAASCAVLAENVRALGLSVITFTGFLWEELLDSGRQDWLRLIEASDIIVDGPFIMALRDIDLHFRGSANQRLIDVRRSLAAGRTVISP
ncbi:MAG: anaerobic ribonucleoside-triphosphate reductase activating protein [Treponema sp.]|jgi:anaerobic ribonucleoside-triphosphate reductase activating protein|nr:anaerobic ribonucleoside-triphosphate reductase activating protein [Treponema sp.]